MVRTDGRSSWTLPADARWRSAASVCSSAVVRAGYLPLLKRWARPLGLLLLRPQRALVRRHRDGQCPLDRAVPPDL